MRRRTDDTHGLLRSAAVALVVLLAAGLLRSLLVTPGDPADRPATAAPLAPPIPVRPSARPESSPAVSDLAPAPRVPETKARPPDARPSVTPASSETISYGWGKLNRASRRCSLEVRVADERGWPLAGVTITLESRAGSGLVPAQLVAHGTTDMGGRWSGQADAGWTGLHADLPDYVAAPRWFDLGNPEGDVVKLRMTRGGAVEGRLTLLDPALGEALAWRGAIVLSPSACPYESREMLRESLRTVQLSEDGAFALGAALLPGSYHVFVEGGSGIPTYRWLGQATVLGGETTFLDLTFQGPTGSVRGRIPQTAPSFVSVGLTREGEAGTTWVRCADRAFWVDHLPPGRYRIKALEGTDAGEAIVEAGRTVEIELRPASKRS